MTDSVSPRFTVSPETTFATEPILADGTPDFGAFLNGLNGTIPDVENAAVVLAPLAGYHVYELPDPERERWAQEALGAVVEASSRSAYWAPYPSGVTDDWTPSRPRYVPDLWQTLRNRGFRAAESGRFEEAAADAMALQRLSLLMGRGGSFEEILSATEQMRMLGELLSFLAAAHASPRELEALAESFDRTPHVLENRGELLGDLVAERLGQLALVIELSRRAPAEWKDLLEPPGHESEYVPDTLYGLPDGIVDWDAVLRTVNRSFDRARDLLGSASPEEYRIHAHAFEQDLMRIHEARRRLEARELEDLLRRVQEADTVELERLRTELSEAVAAVVRWPPQVYVGFWIRARAKALFARVCLELAIAHRETGRWPAHLEESLARRAGALGLELDLHPHASANRVTLTGRNRSDLAFCWDGSGEMAVSAMTPPFEHGSCVPTPGDDIPERAGVFKSSEHAWLTVVAVMFISGGLLYELLKALAMAKREQS